MEKENISIQCPNCSDSKLLEAGKEMTIDKEYVFCSRCGLLLRLTWLRDICNKLNQLIEVKK